MISFKRNGKDLPEVAKGEAFQALMYQEQREYKTHAGFI